MEKINRTVTYEVLLLLVAGEKERQLIDTDKDYKSYHEENMRAFNYLQSRYLKILNISALTADEVANEISKMNISQEQRIEIKKLKREPMFKKVLGEASLTYRNELEQVLGTKISSEGRPFADEKGIKVSVKDVNSLESELNSFNAKLDLLLQNNQITREQYDDYTQRLDYIYNYFISQSMGEQIPFRKVSESQRINIEKMAEENDLSFNQQYTKINQQLQEEFSEVQSVEQELSGKKM